MAKRARVISTGLAILAALCATPTAEAATAPTRSQAWVARIVAPTNALSEPDHGKRVARLGTRARWAGGPNQLLVLDSSVDASGREWLKVQLPVRPNGTSGWIDSDYVQLHKTRLRVDIDLGKRRLTLLRSGHRVASWRVVVGARATPTPTGTFAVSEVVRQPHPHGFIGPWALHLTAFSNVLDNYGGGPGRVAIHGRDGASFGDPLGSARSHGCVRISNRAVRKLARTLVPGAPVDIHR